VNSSKAQGKPAGRNDRKTAKDGRSKRQPQQEGIWRNRREDRDKTMARFDISDIEMAAGGETRADTLCNLGLVYATGRGCKVDLVAAHKWLNIAAIRGSERAASLRADLARNMTKAELAEALRAARDWMTMH